MKLTIMVPVTVEIYGMTRREDIRESVALWNVNQSSFFTGLWCSMGKPKMSADTIWKAIQAKRSEK